jgi:hypothetical protein
MTKRVSRAKRGRKLPNEGKKKHGHHVHQYGKKRKFGVKIAQAGRPEKRCELGFGFATSASGETRCG